MPKCENYGEKLVNYNEEISKGFDKGLDFKEIKKELIEKFNELIEKLRLYKSENKPKSEIKFLVNKLNYLLISLIQLRNGSRISEAVIAYRNWMADKDITEHITVKIAKSEKTFKKDNKTTRARYRKMVFPDWIDQNDFLFIKKRSDTKKLQESTSLKKRTLDYLRKYHECNTHSLRYAFINYMLHDKKIDMTIVGKTVGHVNLNQLIKYTQTKNVDKLLLEDI